MSQAVPGYRWSTSEFLRAFEAGVFERRVELVNGELWPVAIGDWHGRVTFRLASQLTSSGVSVTGATLASGASLPDPDWWVQRDGSAPLAAIGNKLSRWDPTDVLLVAEVSDETILADLTTKATLYGSTGYPEYWVVTPEHVFVHTDPSPGGYRTRRQYAPGERVPLPYADRELDVAELIAE